MLLVSVFIFSVIHIRRAPANRPFSEMRQEIGRRSKYFLYSMWSHFDQFFRGEGMSVGRRGTTALFAQSLAVYVLRSIFLSACSVVAGALARSISISLPKCCIKHMIRSMVLWLSLKRLSRI